MSPEDRELFLKLGVLNSKLSAFAFALQEQIPVAVDEQIALGHRLVDLAEMIRDRAMTQSRTVVEGAAGAAEAEQQSAIDTQTVAAIELGEQIRTDTRLGALDEGDPAASLTTVFSWSYTALSPEQAEVFGLLGLAPGPDISLPAAANLTGLPAAQTGVVLRALEGASLVDEHVPGRYRMPHWPARRGPGLLPRRPHPAPRPQRHLRRSRHPGPPRRGLLRPGSACSGPRGLAPSPGALPGPTPRGRCRAHPTPAR